MKLLYLTRHYLFLAIFLLLLSPTLPAKEDTLNIICGVTTETCEWLEKSFVEKTNIPTKIIRMSSGEALKFIEDDNSEIAYDVWWGGTGDTHLKESANEKMLAFTPSNINEQLGWSKYIWELSNKRSIGIYAGTLGIIANTEILNAQNIDLPSCWSDLGDPKYKGQIIIADPTTSGTAYTFLSTIYQLYSTNSRGQILAEIKENISKTTKSGKAALMAAANAESGLSVAFIHDVKPLIDSGYPIKAISPCEGTGFEIGAASLLASSRKTEQAKLFIEYTLLPETQNELIKNLSLQMFSNINTNISPVYRDHDSLNVINYSFDIYSKEEVRNDVLSTWQELEN